jgi:hypothetical protein
MVFTIPFPFLSAPERADAERLYHNPRADCRRGAQLNDFRLKE